MIGSEFNVANISEISRSTTGYITTLAKRDMQNKQASVANVYSR